MAADGRRWPRMGAEGCRRLSDTGPVFRRSLTRNVAGSTRESGSADELSLLPALLFSTSLFPTFSDRTDVRRRALAHGTCKRAGAAGLAALASLNGYGMICNIHMN